MPEIRERIASVVVVGRLNPLIFQPEWLRSIGAIGQSEAEAAQINGGIELIHRDVAILNLTKMKLIVDNERFVISALEEPFVKAKDFAQNCFTSLPHTPVRALGINFTVTFRCRTAAEWHQIGDSLAPKDCWDVLLGDGNEDRTGGLRAMTMERNRRSDGKPGYVRVTVEALETEHPDTKVTVNDHYALARPDRQVHASDVVDLLEENWDHSMAFARDVGEQIMGIANAR